MKNIMYNKKNNMNKNKDIAYSISKHKYKIRSE